MDEAVKAASEAGSEIDENTKSINEQIEKVKELREQLADNSTTQEEAKNIKQELLGIQDSLVEKYGQKIGPDPASIDSAMIGGIASNNASGMNSGIMKNTYITMCDIRMLLSDGTILDTSSQESCASFRQSHANLLNQIEYLAKTVKQDSELKAKIVHKYRIKKSKSIEELKREIEILKGNAK